jgi:hypothetical protein
MDKVVTIKTSQSLLDLSLQYYGTIENVFNLITQLGVESLDSDPTGFNLTVTETNKRNNVYQFCLKNNLTIANKQSPELTQDLIPIIRYRVTRDSDSRIVQGGDFRIV